MPADSEVDFTLREADWRRDRQALGAVREAVFVAEQGVPLQMEWDEQDPHCLHLLAISNAEEPVGTARMTPGGHIGRMAVLAPWRGRGVGSALLAALLETARDEGLEQVVLNAQSEAVPFYARHGFVAEGPEFMEAGIAHRRMRRSMAGE